MNLTVKPRSSSRTFDIDFEDFPVTTGKTWSSSMQQDCRYEISRIMGVKCSVTSTTNVRDIPISTYFEAVGTPITDENESGPGLEFITLSSRELGPDLTGELIAMIRDMMARDQAELLAGEITYASVPA